MHRPYWYIPAHKDARFLGTEIGTRPATLDYLTQIAQATDRLGYNGVLVPTGTNCEDAWVIASCLVPCTTRLKFIVAVRPGLVAPSAAARMAATFDRMSGGRLIVNVVGGGDPVELAGDGVFLEHGERYALMDEFLTIWKQLVRGEECSFDGQFLRVDKANVLFPCVQTPYPPLFMGGSSPAATKIAVDHIDTLLTWGEPPAQVAEKIAAVRNAEMPGRRRIKFGIRLHIIVRESDDEAWAAADTLIRHLDEEKIARAQAVLGRTQSMGQRRMNALHGGSMRNLEVSPNLWAGVGLVTGGAGTALVGSPETVAARLHEYESLGIETFILSGYPHLEEAYRVAETLFPLLSMTEEEPSANPVQPLRARVIPGGW